MNGFGKKLSSRTVKRQQNWYLRGWEYRETEKGKKLVYTREYYRLTADKPQRNRQKIAMAALFIALCAVYLAFELTPCQGGFVWYAGAPCLLAVIPLFYMGMGAVNYILCEEEFTFRRLHATFVRLRYGAVAAAILLGLGTAGQIVFLARYGASLNRRPEYIMLFGACFCALCSVAIYYLQKTTAYEETGCKRT